MWFVVDYHSIWALFRSRPVRKTPDAGYHRDAAWSGFVLGRLGPRFFEPSYLLATRTRYQPEIVSGVRMPATCFRRCRPRAFPFTAAPLLIGETNASSAICAAQGPVLLSQGFDDILLRAVDPAGEQEEQEREMG
jgi:hypothetical protein